MNEQLLQFLGLQCFLLANAQGQIAQQNAVIEQLRAELAARPTRRKKGD